MPYRPRGTYSAMTVDAVHRAERLQAMALANIHAQYQTEKPKDLYAMTLDEFIA